MSELFRQTRWDSSPHNLVPPTEAVLDSPTRCIEVNAKWAGILAGAIERLADYDIWQGDENTVETAIDKIEEILVQLGTECPAGGGVADYTLESDITLGADTTTYTLSGLDLLSGRDLRVEILLASSTGTRRDLRLRINALTTSIYYHAQAWFGTSTSYARATATYYPMRFVALPSATPQLMYGYVILDIPRWKDTDRYPVIHMSGLADDLHVHGKCHVQSQVAVDSIDLFLNANDLKAGTKIAVYTRGS